ncbi:hypothetical protein, partial [Bradyrhizobium sp.]|uniref:hypothetical protein n=1 Tax=Bradyrhizobium sp. TaxID=376 RepID=UPI00391C827F
MPHTTAAESGSRVGAAPLLRGVAACRDDDSREGRHCEAAKQSRVVAGLGIGSLARKYAPLDCRRPGKPRRRAAAARRRPGP